MQLIWEGPRRRAAILARMLRKQHIDAVMMFTQHEGEGAVYVPDTDVDSPAIPRAIEQSEHDTQGGAQ